MNPKLHFKTALDQMIRIGMPKQLISRCEALYKELMDTPYPAAYNRDMEFTLLRTLGIHGGLYHAKKQNEGIEIFARIFHGEKAKDLAKEYNVGTEAIRQKSLDGRSLLWSSYIKGKKLKNKK